MSDIPDSPADLRAVVAGCWAPLRRCTPEQESIALTLVATTLDDHAHSEASLAGFLGLVRTGTLGQAPQPGNDADAARQILEWQREAEAAPAPADVEFARFEALMEELLKISKGELDRRRAAG